LIEAGGDKSEFQVKNCKSQELILKKVGRNYYTKFGGINHFSWLVSSLTIGYCELIHGNGMPGMPPVMLQR
jgi:hypothetical protein